MIRFLLFTCGGLVAMLFGAVHFTLRVFDNDQHTITLWLSLPIVLASTFMLLYGTGEWGRWRYMLVFILLPISFFIPVWVYWLFVGSIIPMPIPFVVMGTVGFLTHAGVRRHYTRHEHGFTEE